jgi:hypothetical protein
VLSVTDESVTLAERILARGASLTVKRSGAVPVAAPIGLDVEPVTAEVQPTMDAEIASKAPRRGVDPILFDEYMCDSFYILRSSRIWVAHGHVSHGTPFSR